MTILAEVEEVFKKENPVEPNFLDFLECLGLVFRKILI